jgi:hypothetical protein
MAATGAPDIAWVTTEQLASTLGSWLDTPRYVREMGHTYLGEAESLTLRRIRTEFDAIAVIKSVRDSSPTPTGIRRAIK